MLKTYRDLPRQVHVLCVGTFINKAGALLVPFLTLYLQDARGLGVEVATRAMGAFGLGAMAASLLGGRLADRVGRRAVMVASLTLSATILLGFGELTTPTGITLAMVAFALCSEMYRPASAAMIADLTAPAQRTPAYGLMYLAINLGFCVGPVVGGYLAHRSFRLLFWGDALTSLVYAGILLLAVRESRPLTAVSSPSAAGPAVLGIADTEDARATAGFLAATLQILRDRVFVLFCLASLLCASVYMQIMSTFPLHLRQLGIGSETYGGLIVINAAMVVSLQLPASSLIMRLPRGLAVATGALLTALGFGGFGLAHELWQLAALVVVFTAGELISVPVSQAIVGDLAPEALRGQYMGVYGLSMSIALVLGPTLGGMALARLGPGWTWGLCFVVAAVAAILYLAMARRLEASRGH